MSPARVFSGKWPYQKKNKKQKSVPQPIIFGRRAIQKMKKIVKKLVLDVLRSSFFVKKTFFKKCKKIFLLNLLWSYKWPNHVKTRLVGQIWMASTKKPLLGAQDNAQTPKVRTLCSKWKKERPKSEPFAQSASRSAQSLNPFLKRPLEVPSHTVDQKSSQNIIINSCFEYVLGRLAKLGKFIFSTGPGHMAEVSYFFLKTASKWQGGAPWSSEGANPLLKMASWTVLEHLGYWTIWPKSRTLSPKRCRLLGHMAEVAYPFPKTV